MAFASGKIPQNTSAPKVGLGRNLHLIGPFELFLAGFSTEFQRASFVFSRPRPIFGPRAGIWDPQIDILARGPFGANFGVPKKILLRWNDFVVRIQGNPPHPNELYGP